MASSQRFVGVVDNSYPHYPQDKNSEISTFVDKYVDNFCGYLQVIPYLSTLLSTNVDNHIIVSCLIGLNSTDANAPAAQQMGCAHYTARK